MGPDHFPVGVKRLIAIGKDRQRRVALRGGCDLEQFVRPAALVGSGGQEDRVGDHGGSTVRIGAELSGTA